MVDISDIKQKIEKIPENFKVILDYLKDAEGNTLEYNTGEKDITAPLGVYRYEHPNAVVFEYIDSIAKQFTLDPSNKWAKETCKKIDPLLDKDVCYYLAYLFYADFYKSAHLEYFDPEVIIAVVSIYANSPKLCNESLQEAVNIMGLKKFIVLDKGPLKVDGAIGNGTKSELREIDDLSTLHNYTFRLLFLHMVKSGYIELWKDNKEKFSVFLWGWSNRVDRLLGM